MPVTNSSRVVIFENHAEVVCNGKSKAVVFVDLDDVWKVSGKKWYTNRNGYCFLNLVDKKSGKTTPIYMHHVIAGKPGRGMTIDHVNHDRLDNRRENLRIVSYSKNLHNRRTSNQHYGVEKMSGNRKKPWAAVISVNGRRTFIGSFETKSEASKARMDYEKNILGENKKLTLKY